MNLDADLQARWNLVRHDLLNMLLEFHTQWNTAFAVSHNCGHVKMTNIVPCMKSIDNALNKIDDLEDLFARYKKTLGHMKEIAQAIQEATPPEKPE